MAQETTLALDAMGGDKAPDMVLKGASLARERFPKVKFKIYGPKAILTDKLAKFKKLATVAEIIDAPDHITNEETVSNALRQGKNSSMWKAIEAVKSGEANCVVSAGNTGVLMAMSKLQLRSLEGIHRPAIASFLPTLKGETVMMDLGANIECNADNIIQFALMGEVFARSVLGLPHPTVGILNVGSEDHKGMEYLKEAAAELAKIEDVAFQGFVEGDDITAGTVDVIVTDGFTGNVALKTAEGVGKLYSQFLRETIKHSLLARIGYLFSRSAYKRLRQRLDPRRYNGAVFLGLNGVSVKSHGGTDALGFATAIGVAVDMATHNFYEDLEIKLKKYGEVEKSNKKEKVAV